MRRVPLARLGQPGEQLELDAGAAHYLRRVLRLNAGTQVLGFDGAGNEALLELGEQAEQATQLGPATPQPARPPMHLALAALKGPAMDQALRQATEAGMTHLHVVQAERSVPRGERPDRWERILDAAARQSGRADRPTVLPAGSLAEVLARLDAVPDKRLCHFGGQDLGPAEGEAAVLVGPEGGWTEREVQRALDAGWQIVRLARDVLRAETAAAVAVAATAAR